MTRYIDNGGATLFVSPGISKGEVWMTVRQKKAGAGTHRVKSKELPIRPDPDTAQADLDAYAKKRGYRVKVMPQLGTGAR